MPKTPTKTTTHEEDPRSTGCKQVCTSTFNISPLALALAAFADDDISTEFFEAWQTMPELVQQIARGEGSSNQGVTRWSVVESMMRARVETSRISTGTCSWHKRLAKVVDVIEAMDEGALVDVQIAIGEPSFQVGLALGLYLATGGAPVVLRSPHREPTSMEAE